MSTDPTPNADTQEDREPVVVENPWQTLRAFTDARIGLGRAGVSLPTSKLLEFQLAHAQAQDAVHCPLNLEHLADTLGACARHAPHRASQPRPGPRHLPPAPGLRPALG